MDSIPHGRDLTECAMTAESIAKALGGRKVGSGWMARCSAHKDREPSLSISAGDEGIDFYYAIETWQPRLDRDLRREDSRQIVENVTGSLSIRAGWSRAKILKTEVADRVGADRLPAAPIHSVNDYDVSSVPENSA